MNNGLAENIFVFNNTVFCADAGDRTGAIFGAYTSERLNDWRVVNNIFSAPSNKPRALHPTQRGVPDKLKFSNNAFRNITEVEEGKSPLDFDLIEKGEKPVPFFAPTSVDSAAKGLKVDVPFTVTTKYIGAVQSGDDWKWLAEIPKKPN